MRQLPLIVVLTISTAILLWNLSFYDVNAAGPASVAVDELEGATPERLDGWPDVAAYMGGEAERSHPVDLAARGSTGRDDDSSREPGELPQGTAVDDADGSSILTGGSSMPAADGTLAKEVHLRYPSGATRAKGTTRGDVRDGPWVEWYESGERWIEGDYEGGRQAGRWVYWHENGRKQREGQYVAGLKQGRWAEWNLEGEPRTEAHYEEGRREGYFRSWYSNGQVREAGLYVDGLRTGWWEFFDARGRAERRAGFYEGGDRVRD